MHSIWIHLLETTGHQSLKNYSGYLRKRFILNSQSTNTVFWCPIPSTGLHLTNTDEVILYKGERSGCKSYLRFSQGVAKSQKYFSVLDISSIGARTMVRRKIVRKKTVRRKLFVGKLYALKIVRKENCSQKLFSENCSQKLFSENCSQKSSSENCSQKLTSENFSLKIIPSADVVNYFEDTWIGRPHRRGRRAPKFAIQPLLHSR